MLPCIVLTCFASDWFTMHWLNLTCIASHWFVLPQIDLQCIDFDLPCFASDWFTMSHNNLHWLTLHDNDSNWLDSFCLTLFYLDLFSLRLIWFDIICATCATSQNDSELLGGIYIAKVMSTVDWSLYTTGNNKSASWASSTIEMQ